MCVCVKKALAFGFSVKGTELRGLGTVRLRHRDLNDSDRVLGRSRTATMSGYSCLSLRPRRPVFRARDLNP